MRRLLILVISAALLTLGAGCGDDEERLTQEEFEQQGNEICEENNKRLEDAFEAAGFGDEEPPAEDVEQFIDDEVIPGIEQQIEELGELNPPEEIEDDFEQLLEDAEAALDEVRDMSGEEILAEETDPFAEINEKSEELGLDVCAQ